MQTVGRDEAVATPRSVWSSRTDRTGSRRPTRSDGNLFNMLSDGSDCSQVQVVVQSEMDEIAKEPSLHLPGRREDDVGCRSTTEKILSAFGYSNTGQSATGRSSRGTGATSSVESTQTNPPSLPSLEAKPSGSRYVSECSRGFTSGKIRAPRCFGRCCCCTFCLSFLVLALCTGISLAICWPRYPSWKVSNLEVDGGLLDLVTALSAAIATAPSHLFFAAEVLVFNPNLLHGDASEGSIELRYDEQLVGTGASVATTLAPQTETSVFANVTVDLGQHFVYLLQQEIVAERWVLPFKLIAACKVTTILNVQLQYQTVCDIDVALCDLMMSETRNRAVTIKACEHRFS